MTGKPPCYNADTDLRSLGVTHKAIRELKALAVYRLADFSEVTLKEVVVIPGLGSRTVMHIRGALQSIGMDFKPSPDPFLRAVEENRDRHKAGPPQSLTGGTRLEEIGITPLLFERCWKRGLRSLSDVAALSIKEMHSFCGKSQASELMGLLRTAGLWLKGNPSDVELWRYGYKAKDELWFVLERTTHLERLIPLVPYQPLRWLKRAGIETVGALQDVLPELIAGTRKIAYLGPKSIEQLATLLQGREPGEVITWAGATKSARARPAEGIAVLDQVLRPTRKLG